MPFARLFDGLQTAFRAGRPAHERPTRAPIAVDRVVLETRDAAAGAVAGTRADLCKLVARGRRDGRERTAYVATASALADLTTARLAEPSP